MLKLMMYYRWATNYLIGRMSYLSTYALPPRILSIETTERCNLDCIMCSRKLTRLSGKEFTLKQFEHVLTLFPSINTVILLGRGETFMMKDIFSIFELGLRKGIHFTVITNGTMLTPEVVKKIPETGKILVSIDHPHPDKYKEIRKGGDLNAIISNLKTLKKLKPHQWFCIQAVIMKDNIDYLEDFIKLAKDVSADAVKFIYPVIFEHTMESIYIEPSEEINLKLTRAKAYAKNRGIRFVAVPQMGKPRVCVEPWLGLRVSLNGDIFPCCYINNTAESSWNEWYRGTCLKVPQSNYVIGNVNSGSVKEIWNGEVFRLLRKMVRNTRPKRLISPDCLSALRSAKDISQRFSYCSVCLFRYNRAC